MQDFQKLKVWQKSHSFTGSVYRITRRFPAAEAYGLTSQIRRAAISVPADIAEGCGRGSDMDFARFLQIAMGSASEAQYLLLLARDLKYIPDRSFESLDAAIVEIKRMLTALITTLKRGQRSRLIADG